MSRIIKAIQKINADAKVSVANDDIDTIIWEDGTTPIAKADIEAELANIPTEEEDREARANLKASAKAKLIAGEALTQEEADTIVL
tara:strand:- start:240 stop:497 length:258 start_codon:yes stop_codon:yes gene_type:complete